VVGATEGNRQTLGKDSGQYDVGPSKDFSMMIVSTQRPSRKPCSLYMPTNRKRDFSYRARPAGLQGKADKTNLWYLRCLARSIRT
jgi:hypothetical protein